MSRTVTAMLNVATCSHGKENDGGFTAVLEGAEFTFPACGRLHRATRDKYEVDAKWQEAERIAAERLERLAKARAARK